MTAYVPTSPDETRALAGEILAGMGSSTVLALHGDLGSGKTCFVQGVAEALGVRVPVTSPTFTIVNEYEGTRRLSHIDLYRLSDPQDMLAFGLDEYLAGDGVIAIEWVERAGDLVPEDAVHVYFEATERDDERRIGVVLPLPLSTRPC
jgi:tRNA threonylcarbamoyladenosine biosynthesis protein TsaE